MKSKQCGNCKIPFAHHGPLSKSSTRYPQLCISCAIRRILNPSPIPMEGVGGLIASAEAAQILGRSRATVTRLINDEVIPAEFIGGQYLMKESDVIKVIKKRQ